jgi:hypothetical protein
MARLTFRPLEALKLFLAADPQSFYHAAPNFLGLLLRDVAEAL